MPTPPDRSNLGDSRDAYSRSRRKCPLFCKCSELEKCLTLRQALLSAPENRASTFCLFGGRPSLRLRPYRLPEQREPSASALSLRDSARVWFAPSSRLCLSSLRGSLRHQLGSHRGATRRLTRFSLTQRHCTEGRFSRFGPWRRAVRLPQPATGRPLP